MNRVAFKDWLDPINPLSWRVGMLDIALGATALLIIAFGFQEAPFKIAAQLAVLAFLARPPLMRNPLIWMALAAIGSAVLVHDWTVFDNHKYLFVYWFWMVALALTAPTTDDAEAFLRASARFMLAFIFLMAALQKATSPTYMSTEMFQLCLVLDERFHAFAKLVGVDPALFLAASETQTRLTNPIFELEEGYLNFPVSSWVRELAWWITWYDLLIQVAIGALFVFGWRSTDLVGHALLLFFIVTTYLPAPVFGFGWLLLIFAYVLTSGVYPRFAYLYATSMVALLMYQIGWREWV